MSIFSELSYINLLENFNNKKKPRDYNKQLWIKCIRSFNNNENKFEKKAIFNTFAHFYTYKNLSTF